MADVFSAWDPYENEPSFQTWLGYVVATRDDGGTPAPGYDDPQSRQGFNRLPDMLRGFDLHQLEAAFKTLQETWEVLDSELHETTNSIGVIFDDWKGEAKAAAVGYLGSVVDVVRQECEAIGPLGQVITDLFAFICTARKKIDALMGAFCDACAKKFAKVEQDEDIETVLVDLLKVGIVTTLAVGASVGTGGTAFPAATAALTEEIASELTGKLIETTAPATEWSDIVDWYVDLQNQLDGEIQDHLAEIGRRARAVEDPQIDRVSEILPQYLPQNR